MNRSSPTYPLSVNELIARMGDARFGLLDLLPEGNLAEKLIGLALSGVPPVPAAMATELACLTMALNGTETRAVRVVVFGGGTGLSNLIGGDSRNPLWPADPFQGLKEIFPQTQAVVCVTDDGGSSGELLKDLREQLRWLKEDPPRKANMQAWVVGEVAVAIESED